MMRLCHMHPAICVQIRMNYSPEDLTCKAPLMLAATYPLPLLSLCTAQDIACVLRLCQIEGIRTSCSAQSGMHCNR